MVSWNDAGLQLTVGDQELCFPGCLAAGQLPVFRMS